MSKPHKDNTNKQTNKQTKTTTDQYTKPDKIPRNEFKVVRPLF